MIVDKTKDGATSLHIAAGENRRGMLIGAILICMGFNGAAYSQLLTSLDNSTLFSPAHGCLEMLQFYLENLEDKNDINVLDHIHATPALDAAEFGQQESLLMLLKYGANINIKDTVSALTLS